MESIIFFQKKSFFKLIWLSILSDNKVNPFSPGLLIPKTNLGLTTRPFVAIAEVALTNCIGVIRKYPCPIPNITVSPGNHASFLLLRFHSLEGNSPILSSLISKPLICPKLNLDNPLYI